MLMEDKYTLLNKKLNSKFIFVSNNFRFGNKREGNVDLLIENEKTYNYKVVKPKPLTKDKKISYAITDGIPRLMDG